MLEGLVASLLNRFLGMYIRNFDPKQLNVGIWSGDVKLRDLELRREALDQLKLPINVVEGHLGQLTLKIPWSNLRGQPVQVHIEDVFVLAAPKEDAEWDEEEEERRRQAVKIEKLDSAEMLKDRNQGRHESRRAAEEPELYGKLSYKNCRQPPNHSEEHPRPIRRFNIRPGAPIRTWFNPPRIQCNQH